MIALKFIMAIAAMSAVMVSTSLVFILSVIGIA